MGPIFFLFLFLLIGGILYYHHIDFKKYPKKFRGKCGYCKRNHGRNQWYPIKCGEKFSNENGLIFLSQECYNLWMKENIICEVCSKNKRYSDNTIFHKHKKQYYYFCSLDCKDSFKNNNQELFYEGYTRHSIPSDLRKIVWKRDNGKCVKCGSQYELHYDHIIPVSKGGSTTLENIELLCQECNLSKSDKIE
tara:strand:- start:1005 stop:1580 length:576 start_codon:yes stop_codon:yes gene_type:complete